MKFNFENRGAKRKERTTTKLTIRGCFTQFMCNVHWTPKYKMWELVCGLGCSIDWIICGQSVNFTIWFFWSTFRTIGHFQMEKFSISFSLSFSSIVCVNLYSIFAFIERHRIGIKIRMHLCVFIYWILQYAKRSTKTQTNDYHLKSYCLMYNKVSVSR